MRASIRRVSYALLGVGVLALSITTSYNLFILCGEGGSTCLTAAVSFGVPSGGELPSASFETTGSSPALAMDEPGVGVVLMELIQFTSVYLILIAVVLLVVLECMELYYIRRLAARSRSLLSIRV